MDPYFDPFFLPSSARVWGFTDPFEEVRRDPLFRDFLNTMDMPMMPLLTDRPTMTTGKQITGRPGQEMKDITTADTANWMTAYARAPQCDIVQRENEYQINFDVPGVRKEDVKVTLTENRNGQKLLTVSGERKDERTQEDKDRGYMSRRSMYGKFSRTLTLPDHTDARPEKLGAKYENGVLKVIVPRIQEPEKRRPEAEIRIQ